MMGRHLVVSLAILFDLPPLAQADGIYQTGFEPPTFTAGQPLSGNDGWLIRIGPSSSITVQSDTVFTGAQAVRFDANGTFARITRQISYDSTTTTDQMVAISVDAQVRASGVASGWVFIVVFDGPGAYLGTISVHPTGELYLSTGNSSQSSGVLLPRGIWNHIELDVNFANRTLSGYLNGIAISRPFPYQADRANNWGKVGVEWGGGPVGTDAEYFDNFSVASQPAPAEPGPGPAPLITTIAGSVGPSTGLATGLGLRYPLFPIVDAMGNVIFVDADDNRVWRITPDGMMNVIAGNGIAGFSGDGGRAAGAGLGPLNSPGMAFDKAGNLLIPDGVSRIRKVTPAGIISTIAGSGTAGFRGDGVLAANAWLDTPTSVAVDSAGNLYISDSGNNRIRKGTAAGAISTIAGDGTAG